MKYVFPKILIGVFPFIVSDRQKSSTIGLLFCKVIHTPRLYIMLFDLICKETRRRTSHLQKSPTHGSFEKLLAKYILSNTWNMFLMLSPTEINWLYSFRQRLVTAEYKGNHCKNIARGTTDPGY